MSDMTRLKHIVPQRAYELKSSRA